VANPFLLRFSNGNLLEKTRSGNLFWVLVLMTVSGLAVLGFSLGGVGLASRLFPPLLLGFVVVCLGALLLLTIGQFRPASWLTFAALLALVSAVSLFDRTGAPAADLMLAVVMFFLGTIALSAVGVGGRLAIFWFLVGTGVLAWIWFVPVPGYEPGRTLGDWNAGFNPMLLVIVFAAGSLSGAFILVQGHRNLKMMQFDQEIIEATNQMLEATVEDRTRALKTILDGSGQGLFTFGADFQVEPEFSQGCRTIFGQDIAGLEADTLLFPQGRDSAREFRQGLSLYFAGKSKAEVIFDLLEKESYSRGRFLSIDYREAGPGKILVILTDVTSDRQLADRNRADETRRNLVMRALGHKRFFAGLLAEAEDLFAVLRTFEGKMATADEANALLPKIHTFKGNCGFFGFTATQEVAHDFEYAVSDSLVLGDELDYHDLSLDLKRSYYQELNQITEALGKDWLDEAGGIIVPREVYDKVAKYVSRKYTTEARLIDVLDHYRKMPLRDLFSRFPFVAESTAEKLGKRIAPMSVTGGELRILPDAVTDLADACVHIVNNMVDHGIEPTYEREALGKSPEGHVSIDITREGSSVVLRFTDDGRGISLADVEARARAKGLLQPDQTPTPVEVRQLLFAPGFSTRDEVSVVSGRGIGLSAVREEVEKLGGRVEVHSKINAGTTFELILPLSVFVSRRKVS